MPPRRLLHIPRHTLRLAVIVLLVGVALFFALTRTQVGRDGLRFEIERRFAGTFAGRIEIGQLKGNLVQDLFASDIRFFDPAGRLVVEIDSIVARTGWRALFRRRLSIRSLILFRPTVHLVYQADSTWNIRAVFSKRAPGPTGTASPWSFDAADVRLRDGSVDARYEASPPPLVAQGWLFDFDDARATGIEADATLEWNASAKLIDVRDLSAALSRAPLALDRFRGQFLLEEDELSVAQLIFQAGGTDLRLDATLRHLEALGAGTPGDVEIDAELQPSRFDFKTLRRLIPRLPLDDAVTASARMHGPLSRLVVEAVAARRGQTALHAEGTVLGLPDSLDAAMALRNSTLASDDLQAVLPGAGIPDFSHLGRLTLDLTGRGVVLRGGSPPPLRVDVQADVRGTPGRVNGTVTIVRPTDAPPAYLLDLDVDSLDVGRLVRDPGLASTLNGHVAVRGSGLSLGDAHASMRADLRSSWLAGRRADTLHVDASLVEQRLELTTFARQGESRVYANAEVYLNARRPIYRAGVITRRLNLGPLLGLDSLQTSLNTQWTLSGSGFDWGKASGQLTVTFDTSLVRLQQQLRLIPPHRSTLGVEAAGDAEPRLTLSGDVLTLSLQGALPTAPLTSLADLWHKAFAEAIDRQAHKPYRPQAAGPPAAAPIQAASLDLISRQEHARRALQDAGLDSLVLDVALDVKRPDVLVALLPVMPLLQTNLHAAFRVAAGADRMRLSGVFSDDSLRVNRLRADAFSAHLRASAHLDAPLEQSLDVAFDARADSLLLGTQTFRSPSLTARFQQREGQFTLTTDRNGRTGPVRLAGAIDLLPHRNRLTLLDFYLALGDYEWTNPEDQPLDLYEGVAVLPGLMLESKTPGGDEPQRIRLHGILSPAPQDTFFVGVENLALRQLSAFMGLKRSIGGKLDGYVALTGAAQPELTGRLTVDGLALDNDVLGRLTATSRYVPGVPDVVVDVDLTPLDDATAPPAGVVRQNRLHIGGTFRLPQADANDPGAFDLALDIQRADAFFFQHIFSDIRNATGAVAGSGVMRGTLKRPVFDAALEIDDVRFTIPKFNLRYGLDGFLRVDEQAIRVDAAMLRDPTGGTATLSGNVFFNDYRFFSLDLDAALDELLIMDVANSRELPFYGKIWASGDATLNGPVYNALLKSSNVVTSARSEIFIPLTESQTGVDPGFIIFADSTGTIPDVQRLIRRENILAGRPEGERSFTEGMDMDLNIFAPAGSTVHLVIDPLLGDVINAVGSGRIHLQRQEGEFFTYGSLVAGAGDYLFTAGEVFVRRFLIDDGTITWDGDPREARLDIRAAYRTRAARAGLPSDIANRLQPLIPLIVKLHITGRVSSPQVDLDLAVDVSDREALRDIQFLEAFLNQSDRAPEYATSVLLTNSFLLTTEGTQSDVLAGSAFNSVSQLVSSQLNRYLSHVVPNADFSFGVQGDETAQELDVTAGLAIRLLNERLVIRGQGVYSGLRPSASDVGNTTQQSLQGEFVVEIRLSPSVSVEFFYRREGDVLSESILTSTTGAGLSYNTQFSTWGSLYRRLFGDGKAPPAPTAPADSTLVDVQEQKR